MVNTKNQMLFNTTLDRNKHMPINPAIIKNSNKKLKLKFVTVKIITDEKYVSF
jgi:hypothetical protein